jgi:hypothetical protein
VLKIAEFKEANSAQGTLIFKEVYEHFIAPHLRNYRVDWDNLSEDVCYISPDPTLRRNAPRRAVDREKKGDKLTPVERNAYRSPYHCSKVCEYEGYEGELPESVNEKNAGPDDFDDPGDEEAETEQGRENKKPLRKKLGGDRQCFQWLCHQGVCCTAQYFTLGRPKRVKPGILKWHAGWYVQGVQEWIEAAGECKDVLWVTPK